MNLSVEVPPTIVPGAKIYLVGEAPGEVEVEQGRGFVGPAGELLDQILHVSSIPRHTIGISNVVKRRPADNDFGIFYEDKAHKVPTEELLEWYSDLREELQRAAPNVVVALGNEALRGLCGITGILSYRGAILDSTLIRGQKVIPIIHPAYILRRKYWQAVYWTIFDFAHRVLPESTRAEIIRIRYETVLWPECAQVLEFLEGIADNDRWCLDVETIKVNGGGRLRCVGVATRSRDGRDSAICIPIQTAGGPYFSARDEGAVWLSLKRLAERNPNLVNQNIPYDIEYLLDYKVIPSAVYMDVMLAHHTLWAELPKDLGFINSRFSDIPYHKNKERDWTWRTGDQDLFIYNTKDTISTLRDSYALDEELRRAGLFDYYHGYVNRLVDLAVHLQRSRLRVDSNSVRRISNIVDIELASVKERREAITGVMNVRSHKQVSEYLYGTLGLRPIISRDTHRPTTREDALLELRTRYHGPGLDLIIAERHLAKRKSDFLEKLELDPDSYLALGCRPDATKTDRWAFNKSPKYRGLNAQTFPEVLRIPYIADDGRTLVSFDLRNIESVIDAYESNCPYMIEVFNDKNCNFHAETAEALFGHTIDKSTPEGAIEYKVGKVTNHAFEKGEGPKRLAITTGLSFGDARRFLQKLQRQRPEIPQWHESIRTRLRGTGSLKNCLGREITMYTALGAMVGMKGALPDNLVRQGIAWIAQSVPPTLVNRSILSLMDTCAYCWLHHHGHDSALFSVPTEKVEEFVSLATPCFEPTLTIRGRQVQVHTECKVGQSWGFELAELSDEDIRQRVYGDVDLDEEEE